MPTKDAMTPIRRRFYQTFTVIGVTLLIIGALWIIGQIWTPISIILFSAFLVFVLKTPVAFFERKGMPRALGSALMYIAALLVIAAIVLVFVPVVVEQFISFVNSLPAYIQEASTFFSQTFSQISEYFDASVIQDVLSTLNTELAKWAASLASDSASAVFNAASVIGNFFLVIGVSIVVGFWILKDLPKFSKEVHKVAGPKYSQDVYIIARAFSRSLGGYLRGMVVSCLCTGTMAFIAYSIIGLPYPLVMAFFTGLMVFIPFIGPAIAWILAGLIGLSVSPLTCVLAAGLTIGAQMINDNVISPRVMGGTVELHPGIILIVIFIGAAVGGIFGMLCAIPLTSAAKTLFVHYYEKRTGRQLVSEDGALFRGHPVSATAPENDSKSGSLPSQLSSQFSTKLHDTFLGNKRQPDSKSNASEQPELQGHPPEEPDSPSDTSEEPLKSK